MNLQKRVTREQIDSLQREVAKLPQAILTTEHFFADGMYCRSLFRSEGTLIIGKVHKREHFYIVMHGTVRVTVDNLIQEVTGPCIIVSPVGTKRAVLAMTDATCITVHRTDLKDLAKIEEELIEADETALYGPANNLLYSRDSFRALTQKVIAHEKQGFWSDWTDEEREMYEKDNWMGFSKSRGYSDEEIADYSAWRRMAIDGTRLGFKPFVDIADLAKEAALENIKMDRHGEIEKSSRFIDWLDKGLPQ